MEKKLLIDFTPPNRANFTILEQHDKKNGGRLMRLRGKLQEAEQKNGNGRVYPNEVLHREVDKYITGPVKTRTSLGELDHPESSVVSLSNASHVITRVWWEGNDLMGELELLNTPSGKIAQELILAGIPLGISSRGMGSVRQIGETVEVQDDFELLCWDLVSTPSTPMAYMSLAEGKKVGAFNYNKYEQANRTITEILCSLTGVCPLC
jgi:hypothetical protein